MGFPRLTSLCLLLAAVPAMTQGLVPQSRPALSALRQLAPRRASAAREALLADRATHGLGALDDLQILRHSVDAFGQTHVRLRQTHRGIPVWGGDLIAHLDAEGRLLPTTSKLQQGITLATGAPAIPTQRALDLVQRHLPKGTRLLKPLSAELLVMANPGPGHPAFERTGPGEWTFDPLHSSFAHPSSDAPHLLVYRVKVMGLDARNQPIEEEHLVDAGNGAILRRFNALHTDTPVKGSGHSQYNGSVSLDITQRTDSDNLFELRDLVRGQLPHPLTGEVGNAVVDMQNSPFVDAGIWHPFATGIPYSNATTEFGDGGEYVEIIDPDTQLSTTSQTANGQTAGVDASFGLARTWDFYQTLFGRNGIDDSGTSVIMRTHFYPNFPNAFWSDNDFGMTFGDGGTLFKSLTSLDVVGHELSHGVTAWTAGLFYGDESGGLNEANSDIFGTMVEFWSQGAGGTGSVIPDTGGNWTMGEQIVKLPQMNGALRWLYKPSLDGISLDAWFHGAGLYNVHFSSGIGNRMFYFLAQGCTTSGDTSSPFAPQGFPGVGNDKAARIWYRTLTTYLTTFSDFHDARMQAIQAATDLYGAGSPEVAAVENAFGAVNVGPLHGRPEPVQVRFDSGSPLLGALYAVVPAGLSSAPFRVSVSHATNGSVTWGVQGGGSIDADGTFHAPLRVAPLFTRAYEITATSKADPLQFALGLAMPVNADTNDDLDVDALDMAPIALNYGLNAFDPNFDPRAAVGVWGYVDDTSIALFGDAFRHAFGR